MDDNNEFHMNELERMRPANVLPPAAGSQRYERIMDTAMSETENNKKETRLRIQQRQGRPGRRRLVFVGAIAASLVAAGFFITLPQKTSHTETDAAESDATKPTISDPEVESLGKFQVAQETEPIDSARLLGDSQGISYYINDGIGNDTVDVFSGSGSNGWKPLAWQLSETSGYRSLVVHKGKVFESTPELANQPERLRAWEAQGSHERWQVADFPLPSQEIQADDMSPVLFHSTEDILLAAVEGVKEYDIDEIAKKMGAPAEEIQVGFKGPEWVERSTPSERYRTWDEIGINNPNGSSLFISNDAGQSWQEITPPNEDITSTNNFFYSYDDKTIFRSKDAVDWTEIDLGDNVQTLGTVFEFGDGLIAMQVSTGQDETITPRMREETLAISSDNGDTWQLVAVNDLIKDTFPEHELHQNLTIQGSKNGLSIFAPIGNKNSSGSEAKIDYLLGVSSDGISWDFERTQNISGFTSKDYSYFNLSSGPERIIFSAHESTESDPLLIEYIK